VIRIILKSYGRLIVRPGKYGDRKFSSDVE